MQASASEGMTNAKDLPPPHALAALWIQRFGKCVRKNDYANADKMCHRQCVGFGLAKDNLQSRERFYIAEWKNTWPNQKAFTFDVASANIISEHGLILVCLPWVAQSRIIGAPERGGRATIALMCFEENKVLAVHFHLSPNVE